MCIEASSIAVVLKACEVVFGNLQDSMMVAAQDILVSGTSRKMSRASRRALM